MQFIADNTTAEGRYTLGVDETHNNYKEIPLGYQAAGMPQNAAKCLEFAMKTFIVPQGPEGAVPPAALEADNMIVYAPVRHRAPTGSFLVPLLLLFPLCSVADCGRRSGMECPQRGPAWQARHRQCIDALHFELSA